MTKGKPFEFAFTKSMDNNSGVLLYLLEELRVQEFKEAALAYFFLLTFGNASEKQVDDECEKFLESLGGITGTIDFEVKDGIDKLLQMKLASERGEDITPLSLSDANAQLETLWRQQLTETQ